MPDASRPVDPATDAGRRRQAPDARAIDWVALRQAAQGVRAGAYVRYSGFRVGAAGWTDAGHLVTGTNVENASYGLTLCAECGLVSDLARGGGGRLVAVAVVGPDGAPLAPCGRCRQLLSEHGGPDLLVDQGPARPPRRLGELLPDAFGPELLPDAAVAGSEHVASEGGRVALACIRRKQDGGALEDGEIAELFRLYGEGAVADEQMSALLMAIVWRGMSQRELSAWTAAMVRSGSRLDLTGLSRPCVDKHSTGGVGDKVSLVLAPLVAACGAAVPQLSGRGLGHTGGTLDKLAAIRGFRADLGADEMRSILEDVGCVIASAGPDLAPADRRLYALRDVTGTVESIPLIASSILSKKIAEGTPALVLDVKVGSGAFLPDRAEAEELATTMVALGAEHGVRTVALLSAMEAPLGRAVGNAVEVAEAIEVLSGGGPPDVVALTLALAEEMLGLAGLTGLGPAGGGAGSSGGGGAGPGGGPGSSGGRADPAARLADGSALAVFEAMVAAQGGDLAAGLPAPGVVQMVPAPASGVLERLDARAVGEAAWRLGAGRANRDDPVDPAAGLVCLAKPGDPVEVGAPLFELHAPSEAVAAAVVPGLLAGVTIGEGPVGGAGGVPGGGLPGGGGGAGGASVVLGRIG
jgi:thymidine phosphorylase